METNFERLGMTEKAPDEYIGPDGLLYCGTCRQPREMLFPRRDGGTAAVRIDCACQEKARKEEWAQETFRMQLLDLWEDGISNYNGLRFRFADDDRETPKISDACLRYVQRWEEMLENNIGLLFYGTVGTGKTFFASCIGNGLLEKSVPVASTNFSRLLNLLQETREKQQLLDRLSTYALLIIDDLGVERGSAYAAEQVFNVIDARSSSRLPLIVTTNMTLEELQNPPSMQYARIYDRILDLCPVRFRMTGASRRAGNAERRKVKARELLLDGL